MKRIIISVLVLSLLFTQGCSSIAFKRVQKFFSNGEKQAAPAADGVESAPATSASILTEEGSQSAVAKYDVSDSISTYSYLKNHVSEESYASLLDIYQYYGITLEFLEDNYFDGANVHALNYKDYDEMIREVAMALSNLGEDQHTIEIIDKHVEIIDCYDSIVINGISGGYFIDRSMNLIAFGLNYEFTEPLLYSAALLSCIAQEIAYETDLESYGFNNFHTFGFIDYNDSVDYPEDKYLNILAANHIVDNDAIKKELNNVGFFGRVGINCIIDDFTVYSRNLLLSSTDLWYLYPLIEPVRSKADIVIEVLSDVNPVWTKKFFLDLCQPDNITAINNTQNYNDSNVTFLYGYYEGIFNDAFEEMKAVLSFDNVDSESGDIEATFTFSPTSTKDNSSSIEYIVTMSGDVNFTTGVFQLSSNNWLTEKPKRYDAFTIKGNLFATGINAEILNGDNFELILSKTDF